MNALSPWGVAFVPADTPSRQSEPSLTPQFERGAEFAVI